MLFKSGPSRLRASASTMITLLIVGGMAGCGQNQGDAEIAKKLEEANRRIAVLETQLAEAKAATEKKLPASAPVSPTTKEAAESEVGKQWVYKSSEEKMQGGKRLVASVESSNTVSFDFPYAGEQHGTLVLRSDSSGKDIMFRIERGQILCHSYDECSVMVRFDDGKPMTFSATGPADQSSTVLFLEGYNRFLTAMRKAKRVRIAVNIYQQGSPVFEFDVSGFNMEKYQSP